MYSKVLVLTNNFIIYINILADEGSYLIILFIKQPLLSCSTSLKKYIGIFYFIVGKLNVQTIIVKCRKIYLTNKNLDFQFFFKLSL
jgi:hypothetical protein